MYLPRDAVWRIGLADWQCDAAAIRAVRRAVFVLEQGIPERLEWDGRDADCLHVLARAGTGQALGTARLSADGRIGRMAVLAGWRQRGIGRGMLTLLVEAATRRGLNTLYLHAQQSVQALYLAAGFQVVGTPFIEAGIAHVCMRRGMS